MWKKLLELIAHPEVKEALAHLEERVAALEAKVAPKADPQPNPPPPPAA